jgi:hypothetical protein
VNRQSCPAAYAEGMRCRLLQPAGRTVDSTQWRAPSHLSGSFDPYRWQPRALGPSATRGRRPTGWSRIPEGFGWPFEESSIVVTAVTRPVEGKDTGPPMGPKWATTRVGGEPSLRRDRQSPLRAWILRVRCSRLATDAQSLASDAPLRKSLRTFLSSHSGPRSLFSVTTTNA